MKRSRTSLMQHLPALLLLALASSSRSQARPPTDGTHLDFVVPLPEPVSRADCLREIEQKMPRVQRFLHEQHLAGVLLTAVNNFAWITAGLGNNQIVLTDQVGTSSLLIMDDGRRFVITSNSEMQRLLDEDLKGLGYAPRVYKWYEDKGKPDRKLAIIQELAAGRSIGTDVPFSNLPVIGSAFASLRYQLTDIEVRKYRWLGHETTEAVISVARRLRPGMGEFDMEAMASDALLRRNIQPTVLLMGVDRRVTEYHHHTPSAARLQHYAIVNVCARRWGLVASVARFVHFGPVSAELQKRFDAAARISAMFEAHSRPGILADYMLAQAKQWYAEAGYPGVWEEHHQGGAIGYAEREWVAFPGSTEIIHSQQAFAWNPIVRGALSFDTILVMADGIENLTHTDDWPTKKIAIDGKTYLMPEILVGPEESHATTK